ncbi:MAG: hypothetical protein ACTJHC_01885 [Vagococcus sp.]
MIRKKKEETNMEPLSQEEKDQLLTRSRVREFNKNKRRNAWLNTAIVIVGILLLITIYAVLKW